MAQFTDFDAYREDYFADPTANGPTAHPTGSAQQFDGQPSPQDAGSFDALLFNQSALGDGTFDELQSNSAGVSATGYIPSAEDMQNLAHLGSGSDLSSLQVLAHDTNTSQYAHMQTNMQAGRDRSWSASSRVSMASAVGDQRATLFPEVPTGMYPSTFPNVSPATDTVKRAHGPQYASTDVALTPLPAPSHFQSPNASHVYLAQPPLSTTSFSIPGMQTQILSPQVAARGPEGSTPHGQFAVPSASSYTRRRKRHAEEKSNGPELGVSGRHERGSVNASTKRQRRDSTRSIDGLQAAENTVQSPFAMTPFAQGYQLDAATASDRYLPTGIPLAPIPELHGWGGGPEQQQFPQQPTAHSLPASKKGSRRNLTAKMRQDLARMKAARNTRLEARAPAPHDDSEHGPTSFSQTEYAASLGNELVARPSSELANPASTYPAQAAPGDWSERAMNEAYGLVSAPGPDLQDSAPVNELLATPSFEQASQRQYDAAVFPDLSMGLAPLNAIQGQNPSAHNGDWEVWHHHSGDPLSVDAFVNHPTGGDHATSDWFAFSNALAADSSGSVRAPSPGPEEFFGRVELVPPPTGALPSSSYGTGEPNGQHDGVLYEDPRAFAAPSPLHGSEHVHQGTGCPSRCQSCHGTPSAGQSHASLHDHSLPDEDVSPVAETSKVGAKRASTSRPGARGNNKTSTAKRGRQADTAAGPSASKSSGSRIQKDNKYTPTNPPRPVEHLPEIILGETPCPFCVHYMIRTKDKNSPLPSMCQARDHFFGHNRNAPCPAFVFWCVSWAIGGDPVGIPIIGEIIVTHWPDEVAGTKEKGWFRYRMWGAKTLLRPELIKWWKGLSEEEKDEILGKGKGE